MSRRKLPASDVALARFAEHFRKHVSPALAHLCEVQGLLLALDRVTFDEAFNAVLRLANNRGALHLPAPILADLETWICTRLIEILASLEPEVEAQRLLAGRVADDCDRYFAAWAAIAASSDGEGSWCWDYPA
jgi:hypothetical protein